jgi:serine/threonine-protein kinase
MAAAGRAQTEPATLRSQAPLSTDPDVCAALRRLGKPLDEQWRLLRLLGLGGSSAVYEVIGRRGERAAAKVLLPRSLPTAMRARIAAHECALTRAVEHPGVVSMGGEVVTADGTVYLPMELLVGETLDQRRRRVGGRLAPEAILHAFDALLEILAAAHDRDVVHHDVKPSNVFLSWSGQVKLLDFGLARRGRCAELRLEWFGTPGFVAPEQARGEPAELGGQADVWSLGASMFIALSGEHVHVATTLAEEVWMAGAIRARSLEEAAPDLPRRLIEVVDRALAFDRHERWPDVRAMRAALPTPLSTRHVVPGARESGVYSARRGSTTPTGEAPSWQDPVTLRRAAE